MAIKIDFAGSQIKKPQDTSSHGRLAATRFADERQRLAASDAEGDAVDRIDLRAARPQQTGTDAEMLLETLDLEEGRSHTATASSAA